MVNSYGLMMIEPIGPKSPTPVIDILTRKMTAALRVSRSGEETLGTHTCTCGAKSDNRNHWFGSMITNVLAVHYLAYHREEVPPHETEKVLRLPVDEEYPTQQELDGF